MQGAPAVTYYRLFVEKQMADSLFQEQCLLNKFVLGIHIFSVLSKKQN